MENEKCPQERWGKCLETERPSGRIKSCLLLLGEDCEVYEEYLKESEEDDSIIGMLKESNNTLKKL